jgi:hypothetical protein
MRVYAGTQPQRAGGYLQSASAQRVFHTATVAVNSLESTWPSAMSSIARLTRPNNDGPGWTRNRTATPETVRPLGFKSVAGGNVAVTPATVVAVAGVPAPTVAAAAVATPATVAAVAAVPAPTIVLAASATVTPSTVVAVAAVPAPTLRSHQSVTPATVVAVAAVPAPTVQATAVATPATVVAVATVPAPTVRGAAVVAPATVAAVAAVPAPTVVAVFNPTGITGCKVWWDFSVAASSLWQDAARTVAITADGQTIGGVSDLSGTGNHLSQATAAAEPAYKTAIINGLSVARFDNVDDYLGATITADTSWTLFILAQKRAVGLGTDTLFGLNSFSRLTVLGSGTAYTYSGNSTNANVALSSTVTAVNVIVLRINSAASLDAYVNGGASTSFDPNDQITTQTGWKIGTDVSLLQFGDYDVGEIIAYDTALSVTDLDSVGQYLANKWGFTWTPTGAVNATAGPASVDAVASVPAPTIAATAVAGPATVAAVASVPAPTVLAAAVAAPATVAAVAGVPSPTVRGGAIATPATVVAVAGVPAPTVRGTGVATPATVVAVASVPAPAIGAAAIATPATVVAVASVPAPSVLAGGNVSVAPSTVVAIASVPAPTVRGTAVVGPATVVAVATVPAPTTRAAALVFPVTVAAVATVPAPTVIPTVAVIHDLAVVLIGVANVTVDLDVHQPSHSYVIGRGSFYPAANRRRIRGSRETRGRRIGGTVGG